MERQRILLPLHSRSISARRSQRAFTALREIQRYELARIAAEVAGSNHCVDVEKCADGMYNKALLLTMDDGVQVVGKIPNPNAGREYFTTASEVATMDFVGLPASSLYL